MTTHKTAANVIRKPSAWASAVQFLTWVPKQNPKHKRQTPNKGPTIEMGLNCLGWGLAMGNFWVWRYARQCVCIGKPQEHQLMADKLNFAVLNGQSMRRSMV